jgi:hypothetical protein
MTNQHPITPPPELVREWNQEATGTHFEPYGYSEFIANRAAKWGADQELEACCEWLNGGSKIDYDTAALLRAALAEPEEQEPTDEELVELFNDNDWNYISPETFLNIARSVLELR